MVLLWFSIFGDVSIGRFNLSPNLLPQFAIIYYRCSVNNSHDQVVDDRNYYVVELVDTINYPICDSSHRIHMLSYVLESLSIRRCLL